MTNYKSYIVLGIAATLLVVAGFLFANSKQGQQLYGAAGSLLVENYVPVILYNGGYNSALPIQTSGGFVLGTLGTSISKIIAPANCTIIASANTIAASSTKDVDCTVTGAVSGDFVVAVATTSISTASNGVAIIAARASTTANVVTLTLSNLTGGTFTWTATASTSIQAMLFK